MANLNIAIEIAANDKASGPLGKITGALKDMRGTGQSLVSGGFKSLQTVGVAAMTGLATGVVALAGGFLLAGKTAFDMNATLETSTLQFTTLMGDASRAEAHVKSLFDFAKATPFETGPIIEASRMMQTFGGDVLNTRDNLTLVGDAAAATGAPIDELGFWVGRLYSNLQAGQPFGEAAMRLQELAVMSPQARQEMERLQEAGASADEIFAVMQQDLGKFTGAMEDQAGTWDGLKSTISDALAITAATAFKPFFEMAKQGLGGIVTLLENPAFTAGVELFAQKFEQLGMVAGLFIDHIQSGMPFLESFQTLITQVALVFGMAGPEARALGENIGLFVEQVTTAVQPIVAFLQNNVQLQDVLFGVGAAIAAVVIPALISVAAAVAPVIAVFALVVGAVALVRNAWENNWGGIQEKTQAVIDFIVPLIQGALAFIQAFWAANGDAILAKANEIWSGITTAISVALDFIYNGIIVPTVTAIQAFWAAYGADIMAAAQLAWDTIAQTVQGAVDLVKKIVAAFTAAFQGDWDTFGKLIVEIFFDAWQLLIDTAVNSGKVMLTAVTGIVEDVVEKFKQIDWADVGKNIINGIKEGLVGAAGALASAAANAARSALDAAKAALGISSPSKLFEEQVGKNMMLGIVAGLENNQPRLNMAMAGVTMPSASFLPQRNAGSGAASGGGVTYKVTLINPVFEGVQDARSLLGELEALV